MVIEDDASLREVVVEILASGGFVVAQATDGRSALSALRSEEGRTDVILLDLMMPFMNGWQFREAQLADPMLAKIPVVVMSSVDANCISANAKLDKPVDLDLLLATVKNLTQDVAIDEGSVTHRDEPLAART